METAERALSDIGRVGGLGEGYQAGMYWLTGLTLPWMLVIDNADDPLIDYSRFFPAGDNGHILITTRLRDCKIHATVGFYEFRDMEEEDAVTLLLRAADEDADASVSRELAKPIVRTLGCLPLALIQAGASIRQEVCTLAEYLTLYDAHSLDLMRGSFGRSPITTRNSIYTTWEVTVRRIEEEDSETATDAIQILQILAFLHFEQVPISIFERAWNNLRRWPNSLPPEPILSRVIVYMSRLPGVGDQLRAFFSETLRKRQRRLPSLLLQQSTSWNSFRFQAALVILENHSLIYRDADEERTYSMHPMVHSWARERLQSSDQELWSDLAMNTVATSIATYLEADSQRYRIALIPHINTFFKRKRSLTLFTGIESEYSVSRCIKFAAVYSEGGYWKEASRLQEHIVDIWRCKGDVSKAEHMEVMIALADSYWNLDRIADSSNLLSETAQMSIAILGKEDTTTLRATDKLAGALWLCGRRDEAKDLSEEAVRGLQKTVGPIHPHTLDAMDNLGRTLMHLDRGHEAEKLHRDVLHGRKKILGASHPDTLMAMANLAMAHHALKNLDQAEELLELVLHERSRILGKEHPYTLWAINDLSKICSDQGRPMEAESMLAEILDTVVRILGSEHIGMMMTKFNLAHALFMQERWADSERVLREVVELQKRKHVPAEHPDSIETRLELAKVTKHLGRLDEAEAMFKNIVEVADVVYGRGNFRSRGAMGQLAATYIARGRLEEADGIEAMLKESI